MASIVTLSSMEELENTLNVPLGLTRLQIHDVKVESDTTKLFLQVFVFGFKNLVVDVYVSYFCM